MVGPTLYFMQRLSFRGLYQGAWGKPRGKPGLGRVLPLKKPCYVAGNGVMQSLHKNENLLFKDFQDFLARVHIQAIVPLSAVGQNSRKEKYI